MKYTQGLFIYLFVLHPLFSQNLEILDSIAIEICKSVKSNSNLTDMQLLSLVDVKHISPYITSINKSNQESELDYLVLRAQKLCGEYSAIVHNTVENKGDWILVYEKPETSISDSFCIQFFNHNNYFYIEPTGDKVLLEIQDNYWKDNFIDSTFSKLKVSVLSIT